MFRLLQANPSITNLELHGETCLPAHGLSALKQPVRLTTIKFSQEAICNGAASTLNMLLECSPQLIEAKSIPMEHAVAAALSLWSSSTAPQLRQLEFCWRPADLREESQLAIVKLAAARPAVRLVLTRRANSVALAPGMSNQRHEQALLSAIRALAPTSLIEFRSSLDSF